jgi:hypothetical protein
MARRIWLAALGAAVATVAGAAVWAHETYLRMTGGKR